MNTNEEMIRISSREARAKWRDLLDAIYRGSPNIVIERYGKPVAVLVSYEDFDELQQESVAESVLKEPTAVYLPKLPTSLFQNVDVDMNNKVDLQALLQNLSADAQKMVAEFARLLQPSAQVASPTVAMPAVNLNSLATILQEGYAGDALADSEALYDDV